MFPSGRIELCSTDGSRDGFCGSVWASQREPSPRLPTHNRLSNEKVSPSTISHEDYGAPHRTSKKRSPKSDRQLERRLNPLQEVIQKRPNLKIHHPVKGRFPLLLKPYTPSIQPLILASDSCMVNTYVFEATLNEDHHVGQKTG